MPPSLDSLIRPASIAILGASRDPHKWGQRVIRYTRTAGFTGEILAINPFADPGSIPGARVLPSIDDAPGHVDCAFLALPREQTVSAVEACCRAGVGTIVVAASGFGESSAAGAELERRMRDLARGAGARLLGPNCFGVASMPTGVNLTPFEYVPSGEVGLISQSGNVSAQLFLAAARAGIGFSHCIGIGNQLDIGFGDALDAFADDDATRAVALYVEGLPTDGGQGFLSGLQRCRAAGKRVVIIKAGASRLAAAVAETHTRSLAADDRVWDTVLASSGAIRVQSVAEMAVVLQCALVLPTIGPRVAVITDGGGDSVLALDALAGTRGLVPARFDEQLVQELETLMPPAAPRVPGLNPVTLDTAGGVEDDPPVLARCVDAVARAGAADVLVVGGLFGTYVDARPAEILAAESMVETVKRHPDLAVVFQSPLSPSESEPLALLASAGVPFFDSVHQAMETLDRLVAATEPATASTAAPQAPGSGAKARQWSATEAKDLLGAHGISTPRMEVVHDDASLLSAAREIGYPVCLKTADVGVVHKSDVGGVRLGLADEEQLLLAATALRGANPPSPLLVMPSLAPAFEMLVGGFYDPQFGPVIVVGRGGVLAEVERDTVLVAEPVTAQAVERAIRELRCYPVLAGYRSSSPLDVQGLRDIAVALASVVKANPDVAVDLNPVLVYPHDCALVDVRIMSRVGGRLSRDLGSPVAVG